ncbi:hypothetical protein [Arthrospiribacter ruber]|uniref:Lipoprotein n=1 Tax=Arthrospiribacter ruber TaxID=2487934 RepID=A0A951IVJ2_9BACT|nr:hypothetical protein [Arthrospiribacter ruber]MBW3467990.1 hypothetical protein [Arthrospiribacter ruber]
MDIRRKLYFLATCMQWLTVSALLFFACQDDTSSENYQIQEISINEAAFNAEFEGVIHILGLTVINRKLRMKVGYSGCEPINDFTLLVSQTGIYTLPPTVRSKLVYQPITVCLAYFTSNIEIDLQVIGEEFQFPIMLLIEGWERPIRID